MLSLIIPTYNERTNIEVLIQRLSFLLQQTHYEIIIVDDHSRDLTADFVRSLGRKNLRIRVVERVGRHGLASACVEGFLAASGDILAVMDADLQHDEQLLLLMLRAIEIEGYDVVVGSRFADYASHQLSARRQKISATGILLANRFLSAPLSDPMSGFFMLRREVFTRAFPEMSPIGFKVLFDILASSPDPHLRVKELGFTFRERFSGESKLDSAVLWEFIMYLAERLTNRRLSARFLSFASIGSLGVIFHLSFLKLFLLAGRQFLGAHLAATAAAITFNFVLNNLLTYRHRQLRGSRRFLRGLASFYVVCAIGMVGNVGVATYIYQSTSSPWFLSAVAGIGVGTFWNYSMSQLVTWKNS